MGATPVPVRPGCSRRHRFGTASGWGGRVSIDRAALIEAALIALNNGESGYQVTRGIIDDRDASAVLDAVLPLVADAIEAQTKEWRRIYPGYAVGNATFNEGINRAARLVRSLGSPDKPGDDDA
jgi:hypothetical protein